MKKNITINLFGALYAIDEDAYELLERYLNNMKSYFARREGGDEIADDIEHRVAEHLWTLKEQGMDAIDLETVKTVISQIGSPGEMDEESQENSIGNESTSVETDTVGQTAGTADEQPQGDENSTGERREDWSTDLRQKMDKLKDFMHERRYYRDGKDKLLGGVISGLCHYCEGHDPLLWRLLTLVLMGVLFSLAVSGFFWHNIRELFLMCFWGIPLLYVAIWVLAPVAHTTEEQMRMKGKPVTPESIKDETIKEMAEEKAAAENPVQGVTPRGCLSRLIEVAGTILRVGFLIVLSAALLMGVLFVIGSIWFCVDGTWILSLFNADELNCQFYGADPYFGPLILGIACCALVLVSILFALCVRSFLPNRKPMRIGTIVMSICGCAITIALGIILIVLTVTASNRIDDEIRRQNNTRQGGYLESSSWDLLDQEGWYMKHVGNIATDVWGYSDDDPLQMGQDYIFLSSLDGTRPMDCSMYKCEAPEPGTYVLNGLLAANADDIEMVVTDIAGDTLMSLSDRSTQRYTLSSISWEQCRTMPFFQIENVDSTAWADGVSQNNNGWVYFSTPPFRHNGGQLTIWLNVGRKNVRQNKSCCTEVRISRIGLRGVDE